MQKKKMKFYFLLPVLTLAILTLAGCGKSLSQKAGELATEKLIEAQSGGKANVDINGKNVKVQTEQGKFESGENVKLPSDFPTDVYVIEGTIKMAVTDQAGGGQTISIETAKSVEEVSATYQEKLKSAGWKITGTMNFGEGATVVAEKDNRSVSVIIGKSDDKTTVTIGVAKK